MEFPVKLQHLCPPGSGQTLLQPALTPSNIFKDREVFPGLKENFPEDPHTLGIAPWARLPFVSWALRTENPGTLLNLASKQIGHFSEVLYFIFNPQANLTASPPTPKVYTFLLIT